MTRILKALGIGILCLVVAAIAIGPLASWFRETESLANARPDQGQVAQTRDGQIFFQIHGDEGPLVILAHGSGAWSQFWEGSFDALTGNGFRVVAFDMPPMGFSGPAEGNDYGRRAQADRIADLVDHLGEAPILVGHSFGAGPMVEFAFQSPDKVAGLVIVDGALAVGSHETPKDLPAVLKPLPVRTSLLSTTATNPMLTRTLLGQFVYRKDAITDRHIEVLQQPLTLKGATGDLGHWMPSLLVPPLDALSTRQENYKAFTKSAHIIWGDKDTVTPLDQGREIHDLLPNSSLTILQDIGHIPHVEDPAVFNAALISALSKMASTD